MKIDTDSLRVHVGPGPVYNKILEKVLSLWKKDKTSKGKEKSELR